MPTALLLLTLAQFQDLALWTDSGGVVHVATAAQAPKGSTALEGGGYSVIDGDGRPAVMKDGGSRADDESWWHAQFQQAREAVLVSKTLETAAGRDVSDAERALCVTAKTEATSRLLVRTTGTATVLGQGSAVVVDRFHPALVEQRATSESTACTTGRASTGLRVALESRRQEREAAELRLRRLEQQAIAERIPLRAWY